jgi:hypothetical protein
MVAMVAVGLSIYASLATFEVVAIVQFEDAGNVADYHQLRSAFINQLQQNETIRSAAEITGSRQINLKRVKNSLEIAAIGESELIKIAIRGRKFRDNQNALSKLLASIVEKSTDAFDECTTIKLRSRYVVH